ncbi:MAG: NAD(P)H-dependent oxidoreductase [Balneolaceae bacterium]|nr:NAD(P)H-dependent oxidoreductase [Balneolaceae bacterium]
MENHIIAFAGSNSSHSINEQLIKATIQGFSNKKVQYIDLKQLDIPVYGIDLEQTEGIPEEIKTLHQQMLKAEGFIIASPEHNGLMPAFFKNIIDWLSRIDRKVFMDKPVLLMSTSPGANGGATSLSILAGLMPFWGANVIDTYSLSKFNDSFDMDSQSIVDKEKANKLADVIKQFERETAA